MLMPCHAMCHFGVSLPVGNMFEGAIPPLPPKSPLTVLDLSGSSSSSGSQSGALAGTVPPSIANAPSLLTLDLSNNKLTGSSHTISWDSCCMGG